MKLKFGILFILAQLAFVCMAQKSIEFKNRYIPQTEYNQTITQKSHTSLTYLADKDIMEQLEKNGIENPTNSTVEAETILVMRTGKMQENQFFPFEIEFISTKRNDNSNTIPDGTKILGHIISDNVKFDSISSNDLDENFKNQLLKSIDNIISQFNFPNKTIKIGDFFEVEMPLKIPIGDESLNMVISSNYELISIENNIAFFDITQSITMVTNIINMPITATGNGKGKFKYSLDYNFIIDYKMDSELFFKMIYDNYEINMKQESSYVQKSLVSKRK